MIFPKKSFILILIIWFLFAGLGLYRLSIRPALPYSIQETKDGIRLVEQSMARGKKQLASPVVRSIDSIPVSQKYAVAYIVENKKIGDQVTITLANNTSLYPKLVPRADIWTVLMTGAAGLFCLTIFILLMTYGNQKEERYFSFFAYFLGLSIAMTWPGMRFSFFLTFLISIVYFLSYSLAPVALLFFSLHFPSATIPQKTLMTIKYVFGFLGLMFTFSLTVMNLLKIFRQSPEFMWAFDSLHNRYFRSFFWITILFSVASIFLNSRREPNPINQRKVQWIIGGVLMGGFPFLVLWSAPQIFNLSPLIPEWAAYPFLILAPAFITVAILKYRLFDIEIVLSRSLVYSAVIIILAGVYLLSVGALSLLLFKQISLQSPLLSVLAAILIAMLFNPLKTKVQIFVNKKFFRISYDRFRSLQACKKELEVCNDQNQILSVLGAHFQKSIPTKDQMFLINSHNQWESLDRGWKMDRTLQQWLDSKKPEFFTELLINIRQLDKIELDLPAVTAELPSPWVIMIPIGGEVLWFLGQKKSGSRFWKEDLELASHMASGASLEWEKFRLILQKQREAERIQTAKMESLRRLVAGTSHELNNPIGVIASSTDVSLKAIDKITKGLDMGSPKASLLKTTDLLRILKLLEDANRSCKLAADKVAKIVVNLRRFVRLDEGERQMADIHEGLDSVLALIEPEIENQIDIQKNYGPVPKIYCSPSGLNQVFMYVLKNAVEAIEGRGEIQIRTYVESQSLKIQIRDTGIGIQQANLNKIFDPGFTTKGVKVGVGLGLPISYHIIKEHNGSIDVASQLGKGSTITITLPLQNDPSLIK